MYYDITKVIIAQLFPKGVLPTAIPLVVSGLLVLVWLVIKNEDRGLYKIVYNYLGDKPKWLMHILSFSHIITLAGFWILNSLYPEIKLGFLGRTIVFVLICAVHLIAIMVTFSSARILGVYDKQGDKT